VLTAMNWLENTTGTVKHLPKQTVL